MSLKEAKRHAAEEAILHTKYIIPERKGTNNDAELTPTVELNNIAIKLGMKVQYLSEDELKADVKFDIHVASNYIEILLDAYI